MKKKFLVLFLISLLLFNISGCKSQEERQMEQAKSNWEKTSAETKLSIYCALVKEYMLLVEDLGENTPYPAMNRTVKGSMMSNGLTQSAAIEQAEEVLIREQAVYWRAGQDGIHVTDDEVKQYIQENIIAEVAQAEDYDVVSKACEKEGVTFEDTIWAYTDSYKAELLGKKAGVKSYEELETYKADAVEQYKLSDAYAEYKSILDNCAQLIHDNVTDKKVLKEADIYYE